MAAPLAERPLPSSRGPSRPRPPDLRQQLAVFLAMSRKQLLLMTRYPVEFVTGILTVVLIISMFSLATFLFLPPDVEALGSSSGLVAYGFVLFLFVSDALWQMGVSLRREQYEGTLEALYLAPVSKFANLVSRIVPLLFMNLILGAALVLFLGALVGRVPFEQPGLAALILACAVSGSAGLGFSMAAYTLVAKESAETVANFVQFALIIFCGMLFPFSALPAPLLAVSRLIPFSYVVDLFRTTLVGRAPELAPASVEWPIVVIYAVLMPVVGYGLYQWAERRVRRAGSLADY